MFSIFIQFRPKSFKNLPLNYQNVLNILFENTNLAFLFLFLFIERIND